MTAHTRRTSAPKGEALNGNWKRATVYVSPPLYDRMAKEAGDRGTTLTMIVREKLEQAYAVLPKSLRLKSDKRPEPIADGHHRSMRDNFCTTLSRRNVEIGF